MPPNEVVVLVSFEITMNEVRGILNLCVPFNTIETKASKPTSDSWMAYKKKELTLEQKLNLETGLSRAKVPMSIRLACTSLTTSDVMNLEVGDVILTEQPSDKGAEVQIAGRPVFTAFPGIYKGQKAIRIGEQLESPKEAIRRELGE